jgi:hypothetical protein
MRVRTRTIIRALTLATLSLMVSPVVVGHHSVVANFDREVVHTLRGTVTAFHLRNPHSHLEVDVVEADGSIAQWLLEWGSKNDLTRRGVDLDRVSVGDELVVKYSPSRQLEHVGYFTSALLPDGTTIGDCGFRAFSEALANNTEYQCEEATGK